MPYIAANEYTQKTSDFIRLTWLQQQKEGRQYLSLSAMSGCICVVYGSVMEHMCPVTRPVYMPKTFVPLAGSCASAKVCALPFSFITLFMLSTLSQMRPTAARTKSVPFRFTVAALCLVGMCFVIQAAH